MPLPLLLVVCICGVILTIIVIESIGSSVNNIIRRHQTRTNPPLNSIEII